MCLIFSHRNIGDPTQFWFGNSKEVETLWKFDRKLFVLVTLSLERFCYFQSVLEKTCFILKFSLMKYVYTVLEFDVGVTKVLPLEKVIRLSEPNSSLAGGMKMFLRLTAHAVCMKCIFEMLLNCRITEKSCLCDRKIFFYYINRQYHIFGLVFAVALTRFLGKRGIAKSYFKDLETQLNLLFPRCLS